MERTLRVFQWRSQSASSRSAVTASTSCFAGVNQAGSRVRFATWVERTVLSISHRGRSISDGPPCPNGVRPKGEAAGFPWAYKEAAADHLLRCAQRPRMGVVLELAEGLEYFPVQLLVAPPL